MAKSAKDFSVDPINEALQQVIKSRSTPPYYKLPGHELGAVTWFKLTFGKQFPWEVADHQWDDLLFFESIKLGEAFPPRIRCKARGQAKTTWTDIGITWTCVDMTRHFWLIISRTQDAIERRVEALRRYLEIAGATPRVSPLTGRSKGWSALEITTQNGFKVIGASFDTYNRGMRDELGFRPDGISLDDIDSEDDTIAIALTNMNKIKGNVLALGSVDCITTFYQNEITANTIMHMLRVGDPRCDLFSASINDNPVVAIPALYDFEYETHHPSKPGQSVTWTITKGTPAWNAFGIKECQHIIDTLGLEYFLREYQHVVQVAGTRMFGMFQGEHYLGLNKHGRHIYLGDEIKSDWEFIGCIDYGFDVPYAFYLIAITPEGFAIVWDELYDHGVDAKEQGDAVFDLIENRYGLKAKDVKVHADPATFYSKTSVGKRAGYEAEFYKEAGLRVVRGPGNDPTTQKNGWAVLIRAFNSGQLLIRHGAAPNLVRQIECAIFDAKRPGQLDDKSETQTPNRKPSHMDGLQAVRYGIQSRLSLPGELKDPAQDENVDPQKEYQDSLAVMIAKQRLAKLPKGSEVYKTYKAAIDDRTIPHAKKSKRRSRYLGADSRSDSGDDYADAV